MTGGSTGLPKLVGYSREQFARVVEIKRKMLAGCGIGEPARVLVLHPMAPWAIGEVFCAGAIACGAKVFPAGLTLQPTTLAHILTQFAPNVICGGGRYLQRVLSVLPSEAVAPLRQDVHLVLTAGEKLTPEVREDLQEKLRCKVRDIYGCAELDALGIEDASSTNLRLVEDFEYRLRDGSQTTPLLLGARGVLEARPTNEGKWHSTGDIVTVKEADPDKETARGAVIEIEGRIEMRVKFGDGSAIGEMQLNELKVSLGLSAIQLLVHRDNFEDSVEVLFVASSQFRFGSDEVIRGLLRHSVDFADAYQAGCICQLSARQVSSELEFRTTERLKAPTIMVLESRP